MMKKLEIFCEGLDLFSGLVWYHLQPLHNVQLHRQRWANVHLAQELRADEIVQKNNC